MSRITSILNATQLDTAITKISTFHLAELEISTLPEFQLPTNRRLGHLIEKIVSELIKASKNYRMLYENVQIIQEKNTIGEIDFIIQNVDSEEIIHLELAYKFYLFDPTLSSETNFCWIGPNRKDALHEKLNKLTQKQFPLLYHEASKAKLPNVNVQKVTQKVCVLANLFVPYQTTLKLNSAFQKSVKGVYMNFETFQHLDHPAKAYYIPSKTAWGISPSENETWTDFKSIEAIISKNLAEKRSLLCWQKYDNMYECFFIVWWSHF
ncbi:MAG: DUF1853 family protein [Kordia sp.]|uniref:DUF1853 family protein n=1 Tax=Kordia sp. TaxID=1965332 RepID=UPI0038599B8C